MSAPVRTCIGCRRRAAASELIRVAVVDGEVRLSQSGGRGAWLCQMTGCFEAAASKGRFSRALRVTVTDRMLEGMKYAFVSGDANVGGYGSASVSTQRMNLKG